MNLFDVYPRYDIEPTKGTGSYIWDSKGIKYLDLYGGHAVISIGHNHPTYVKAVGDQLNKIGFYSNSVQIPIQNQFAEKLGQMSSYSEYSLFLCNSGAEANENALKLASFHTNRKKTIVFEKGFHGRTSLAVEATDSSKIEAPINHTGNFLRLPLNDLEAFEKYMDDTVAAVLIEGIQGISGIHEPSVAFLQLIEKKCKKLKAVFIADEIQSGYGRSGYFFAHQYANVKPDIISIAKGMGNGFPVGGILINPKIQAWSGMLGSTFGGNHLACAAGLAVLQVIDSEDLIENATTLGDFLISELTLIDKVKSVRGRGLMIGIELNRAVKELRDRLLFDHHIFIGSSSDPNTLRLLPPLSLKMEEAQHFIAEFKAALQ